MLFKSILCALLFVLIWKTLFEPDYFLNLEPPVAYYNNKNKTTLDSLYSHHALYHVVIKQSQYEPRCFLIIIAPQNYHFFIEHERIIYHPVTNDGSDIDGVLKYYRCEEDFELTYQLPVNFDGKINKKHPRVLCHRNLEYVKKYIYTREVYYETFDTLQHPMSVLKRFFTKIQKIEGMKKLIRAL